MLENNEQYVHIVDGAPLHSTGLKRLANSADIKLTAAFIVGLIAKLISASASVLIFTNSAQVADHLRHRNVENHEWVIEKAPPATASDAHPSLLKKLLDSAREAFRPSPSPVPVPVPTQMVGVEASPSPTLS